MSSLPSFDTKNEPQISRSVEKFFKDYKVMELLRRCGLRKSKGIPLWSVLSYIFSNVFRDRSMYMQQKSGKCTSGFSKNTYYRFMQNPHINANFPEQSNSSPLRKCPKPAKILYF
ncbi:hypothetical protein ME800_14940 [Lactobacillus delbrueckii]|nr:hypothetical protein ME800_14940 [Lactobacillus delbrueckii]